MSWKSIATEELRKERASGGRNFGQALKRASARYRGRRSNPGMGKIVKYAIYGGAAYLAYKAFTGMQQATPAKEVQVAPEHSI